MKEKRPGKKRDPGTKKTMEKGAPLSACQSFCSRDNGKTDECRPLAFMTEREHDVLGEMRKTKHNASKVKVHLKQIDEELARLSMIRQEEHAGEYRAPDEIQMEGLTQERLHLYYWLGRLRDQWQVLEAERVEAAEERMRLLGHIE